MKYYPYLSIAENAKRNNCSEAAVRKHIKEHGIDRILDSKITRYRTIQSLLKIAPDISISEISNKTGYSRNTIKKYLAMEGEPCSIFDTSKVSTFDNRRASNLIKSISYSQDEILQSILALYVKSDSFDCDLTYSLGYFYKKIIPPKYKFDIFPQSKDVYPLSEVKNLVPKGTLSSIVIDLPFIVNTETSAKNSMMSERFNCFSTIAELYEVNSKMIALAYALLRTGGYLIMKTMDFQSGGKQEWVSHYVHTKGIETGFELKDLFILIAKHKVLYMKGEQRCSRKYHSYFFVFRKLIRNR